MEESQTDLSKAMSVFGDADASLPEKVHIAQRLIEVLPVPVFFKSRDGHYLGVNAAWEEFFGVGRDSIIGRDTSHLYSHAPAISAQHESMDRLLWERPGRQSYEIALTLADGRTRHTLYHKATFTGADGTVGGLIGTIIDITDRKRAEQRQSIEHAVSSFLGEAGSVHDAIRGIIQVVCDRLDWDCGARWSFDESDQRLHCVETWCIEDAALAEFQRAGARETFVPGQQGLIREVLASGASFWIPDVSLKRDFLRAPLAATAGLRAGFALPIRVGERVLGALEFFSREVRPIDPWLLQVAMGIGGQIGQLMARREAEAATRESEARFRSLTELSSDWYWEQDENLRFTMISRGVENSLKVPSQALLGKCRWEMGLVDVGADAIAAHKADLAAMRPFQDFEYGTIDAAGELHYVSVSGQPIFNDRGVFTGYRGVGKDVTRRKLDEEALRLSHARLERQANFDALTGLPNRHLLADRLRQAMFQQRERRPVALVFIDLDSFKSINDTLGHNAGDEVLCRIGQRLQASVREGDTVARVGGDEFVLLLNDQPPRETVLRSIHRIVENVAEPMVVAGRGMSVSCSAGISFYPQDGPDLDCLLKNADAAMYRAKSRGRNTFEFHDPEMNRHASVELARGNAAARDGLTLDSRQTSRDTWRSRLEAAASEEEVIGVVNDFVATWTAGEIAQLPAQMRPARATAAADIEASAGRFASNPAAIDAADLFVRKMAAFIQGAAERLRAIQAADPKKL